MHRCIKTLEPSFLQPGFGHNLKECNVSTSIKLNGKEVKSSIGRILVVGIVVIGGVVLVSAFSLMALTMLLILLSLLVLAFLSTGLLHLVLLIFGRRGFYVQNGNSYRWTSAGAYQRR